MWTKRASFDSLAFVPQILQTLGTTLDDHLDGCLRLDRRRMWQLWAACLVLVAGIYSLTLASSPTAWLDEVFIVDYGHVLLTNSSEAISFNLRGVPSRPMEFPAVLGTSLHEWAYRALAPSNLGPRIVSCLSAAAGMTFFLLWLLEFNVPEWPALLLAIMFLLDPTFVQSYRGARCDAQAFCCIFVALWSMQRAQDEARSLNRYWLILTGAALTAAVFSWPSATLIMPLVGAQYVRQEALCGWRGFGWRIAGRAPFVLLGGVLVAVPLLVLWGPQIALGWQDTRFLLARQQGEAPVGILENIQAFFSSMRFSIFVLVAGFLALLFRGNRYLALALCVGLWGVAASKIYTMRALYALPFFYALVAGALTLRNDRSRSQPVQSPLVLRRSIAVLALAGLGAGVCLSLGARTMTGFIQRGGKTILPLIADVERVTGHRNVGVYISDPENYYVARALGWQCVRTVDFGSFPEGLMAATAGPQRVEWALVRSNQSADVQKQLESLGFQKTATIRPNGGVTTNALNVSGGSSTFGPYLLFKRPGAP
jgi:hypothetical protein